MTKKNARRREPRRTFLARLGAGATVFGTTMAAAGPVAAQSARPAWQPGRHAQDDWLDEMPGSHRLIFDTISPQGFGNAMLYANNFFVANLSGYGLKDADIAVVLVARHNSTACAFNDVIWAKYGATLAKMLEVTGQPPAANPYSSMNGVAMAALAKRGVQLAVCQMATRRFAGVLAQASGGAAETVYTELAANLIPNSHMVPAGIVAVGRAQERGFSFAHGG